MPLILSLGGKEKQNSSESFFLLQVNYNFLESEINTNEPCKKKKNSFVDLKFSFNLAPYLVPGSPIPSLPRPSPQCTSVGYILAVGLRVKGI